MICIDKSLSARRAWIEIIDDFEPSSTRKVALRKESVDRNSPVHDGLIGWVMSLSARRAWIEICDRLCTYIQRYQVALRKESVDRNISAVVSYNIQETSLSARRAWIEMDLVYSDGVVSGCRSPQGERG